MNDEVAPTAGSIEEVLREYCSGEGILLTPDVREEFYQELENYPKDCLDDDAEVVVEDVMNNIFERRLIREGRIRNIGYLRSMVAVLSALNEFPQGADAKKARRKYFERRTNRLGIDVMGIIGSTAAFLGGSITIAYSAQGLMFSIPGALGVSYFTWQGIKHNKCARDMLDLGHYINQRRNSGMRNRRHAFDEYSQKKKKGLEDFDFEM